MHIHARNVICPAEIHLSRMTRPVLKASRTVMRPRRSQATFANRPAVVVKSIRKLLDIRLRVRVRVWPPHHRPVRRWIRRPPSDRRRPKRRELSLRERHGGVSQRCGLGFLCRLLLLRKTMPLKRGRRLWRKLAPFDRFRCRRGNRCSRFRRVCIIRRRAERRVAVAGAQLACAPLPS